MKTWLWKVQPLSLRIVGFGVIVLLLLATETQLQTWYRSPTSWLPPTLAILFLASGYGMMRLWSWARRIIVAILWSLIFVLTVGVINPYHAMEMKNPPPVAELLVIIVPAIAAILWVLHILGKCKGQFQ